MKSAWSKLLSDRGARAFNPALFVLFANLNRVLKGCESVLDLGCGSASRLQYFDMQKTGVDGHEPTLQKARDAGTHNEFVETDVRGISTSFSPDSFDVVVALDLIEHLSKEDGFSLLDDMERIACKRVAIFTPNGFMEQDGEEDDLQKHLSGWSATDFSERGYRVYGMHGLKRLRDGVRLRYRPRFFWGIVSLLSQLFYTYRHPQAAGHLFAVRDMT